MAVFICDFPLAGTPALITEWPNHLKVERIQSPEETDERDLRLILNFWNPSLAHQDLAERFKAGATLWLIRSEGQLAGYGWTLTGHTMRPYYVPLGANDVHLFDYLVFPEFRGRRINPALVNHILAQLSREGRSRAFIEVAEWNQAELKSLGKTPFRALGLARKKSLFGRTIVDWGRPQGSLDQKT